MKLRLASALLISILLIGGAGWVRAGSLFKNSSTNSLALESASTTSSYDFSIKKNDSITPEASTQTGPLSSTDLIGRQLILDYVDLAAQGEASEENLALLANNYVEKIPSLNYSETISYKDIKSVSNTRENFQNYANEFTKIYKSYAENIKRANDSGKDITTLGPGMYSLANSLSKIYSDTANKIKSLPVPLALAENHYKIINVYLSNSAAMKAISRAEQDSSEAFAGMVALNKNLEDESTTLDQISKILTSNGI